MIFFAAGRPEFDGDPTSAIEDFVAAADRHFERGHHARVVVRGAANASERDATELAAARAERVRRELELRGIPSARMTVESTVLSAENARAVFLSLE